MLRMASIILGFIVWNRRKNDRNDRTLTRKRFEIVGKCLDNDRNTVGQSSPHRALGEHCLRRFGNLSKRYLLDFEVNILQQINILANISSEIDQYRRISGNIGTLKLHTVLWVSIACGASETCQKNSILNCGVNIPSRINIETNISSEIDPYGRISINIGPYFKTAAAFMGEWGLPLRPPVLLAC